MTPTIQTRLTIAGLTATLLSAVTLQPLVRDLAWVLPLVVVITIVVGSGAAIRQITGAWPVVLAVQLVAALVTLTALFVRDEAVWGVLPGPGAVAALRDLLQDGLSVTRQAAAPVPDSAGVILLVVAGLAAVAIAVDVIAVSLYRPAVAGLPLLAVYCVPAAVLAEGVGWLNFVIAASGYLVLVGADAGDRIRSWGRVLGGRAPERGRDRDPEAGLLGGPLSGARRVAAVSLAVAVVLPLLIPGLDERLLNNGGGSGPGKGNGKITVLNPILTLRQNLGSRSPDPVITYTTTVKDPEPLRIVSDDAFDGERWAPTTGPVSRKQRVQEGLSSPPGLTAAINLERVQTKITVGNLKETFLPLPYPTTKVDISGDWLYDTNSLNVVGDAIFTNDVSYTAQHLVVIPTAAQLEKAPSASVQFSGQYTRLPETLPQQIRDTAVKVAGTGSAYQQAVRLQDYLRSSGGFSYSERASGANGDDSGENAVLAFLRGKQGYCVQFASTMAVMARTLGIPSRVAVGFLPGRQASDGRYVITLQDAHAWPELYFEGVGWVRFEPTPAARVRNVPPYSVSAGGSQPAPSVSVSAAAATDEARPSARPDVGAREAPDPVQARLITRIWQAIPWRLLGLTGLFLLLLAAPMFAAWLTRRNRWRQADTPTRRAEAAWDDLRERLTDLGIGWAASWTPRALRHRLGADHRLGDAGTSALDRLIGGVEQTRYALPNSDPGRPAGEIRRDVDLVIHAVARNCGKRARRRARWFPRSGVEAITGFGRRIDLAGEEAGRRAGELGSQLRKTVGSGRR